MNNELIIDRMKVHNELCDRDLIDFNLSKILKDFSCCLKLEDEHEALIKLEEFLEQNKLYNEQLTAKLNDLDQKMMIGCKHEIMVEDNLCTTFDNKPVAHCAFCDLTLGLDKIDFNHILLTESGIGYHDVYQIINRLVYDIACNNDDLFETFIDYFQKYALKYQNLEELKVYKIGSNRK